MKKSLRLRRIEGWNSGPPRLAPASANDQCLSRRLAAVSGASALALAGIFPFTAIVARLAATFAFTRILSFTGVNVLGALAAHLAERDASLARYIDSMRLHGKRTAN